MVSIPYLYDISQISGSVSHHLVARFFALSQQSATDDVTLLGAEFLYQRTHIGIVTRQTADHSHTTHTATHLTSAGEAATEGSSHIHGSILVNRQAVGVCHNHRLAAVATLLVEGSGSVYSFFFCHSFSILNNSQMTIAAAQLTLSECLVPY